MAINCVNKSHPEFKKLVNQYGVRPYVIETLTLIYRDLVKEGFLKDSDGENSFPNEDFIVKRLRNDANFNVQEEAKNYGIYPKDIKKLFPDKQPKDALSEVAPHIVSTVMTDDAVKFHLNIITDRTAKFLKRAKNRAKGADLTTIMKQVDVTKEYNSSQPEFYLKKIALENKKMAQRYYSKAVSAVAGSKLDLEVQQSVENYFTNESAKLSIKLLKELRMVKKRMQQIGFNKDLSDKRMQEIEDQLTMLNEQIDFREFDYGNIEFVKNFYEALLHLEANERQGTFKTQSHVQYLGEVLAFYRPMLEEIQDYFRNRDKIETKKNEELDKIIDEFGINAKGFSNKDKLNEAIDLMLTKMARLQKIKDKMSVDLTLQNTKERMKQEIKDPRILQQEMAKAEDNITKNDYDDSIFRTLAGSLGRSKDVFARVYHKIMTDVNKMIRNFTYSLGQEIMQKAKDLDINLATFGKKVIDKDNPHDVITPYDWHWANTNLAKEFSKINAKYGLPENKDLANEMKRKWGSQHNFLLWDFFKSEYNKRYHKPTDYIVKKGKTVSFQKEPGNVPGADFEMTIENYLKSEEYLNYQKVVDYANDAKLVYPKYYRPKSDAAEIVEKRKKDWGENSIRFLTWEKENVGKDFLGNTYYKGELLVPIRENKQYKELSNEERDFLEYLLDIKEQADYKIPFGTTKHRRPQIKSDWMESVFKKKDKYGLPNVMEALKEGFNFTKDSDDIMFGEEPIRRADGSLAYNVPTHFIREVEDPSTLTEDFVGSIILYSQMAENAKQKYKIMPQYESLLDTLKLRTTTVKGKDKSKGETEVVKAMSNFMKSELFGIFKDDPGSDTIRIFGREISTSKLLNKLNDYVRANNLALKWSTAFVGTMSSTVNFNLEKLVGSHTDKGASTKAAKIYLRYVPLAIKETGKVIKRNKLSRTLQSHFVLQDVEDQFRNTNFTTRLGKKVATEKGYINYLPAEHGIKSNIMLSMMSSYRLYNGEFYRQRTLEKMGVEYQALPTYWEALNDKATGFKYEVNNPKKELSDMQIRVEQLINDVDGRISPEDRAAAHRHYLLQFVATHRNWLFGGFDKRFSSAGYNYRRGAMEEGYYKTSGRFLGILYNERIRSLKDAIGRFKELEPYEQEGVKRTMYEMLLTSMFITLATMINYLADEDDEETMASRVLDYMSYITTRTYIEFTTLQVVPAVGMGFGEDGNPKLTTSILPPMAPQLLEVIQSPVTGVHQINNLMELTQFLEWGEEVQSGPYEGFTKGQRFVFKSFPGGKGLVGDRDPISSRNYLLNSTVKYLD